MPSNEEMRAALSRAIARQKETQEIAKKAARARRAALSDETVEPRE